MGTELEVTFLGFLTVFFLFSFLFLNFLWGFISMRESSVCFGATFRQNAKNKNKRNYL
jgi:hypothetical protein